MIELQPNTLYLDTEKQMRIRLLYCQSNFKGKKEHVAYVIRVDGGASMPYEVEYDTFAQSVEDGIYQRMDEPPVRLPIKLTKKQTEAAEEAWKLIGGFVTDEPRCYIKKLRARFISQKAEETGCQRTKISRLLHRYWEGGMTRDALIPQYDKRGGEGDAGRLVKKPLGRKSKKVTDNLRMTIGEKERQEIQHVVDKYYNAHTKYNYRGCYQELLNLFYRNEDESYAPAYPTYDQFYYHARKMVDLESRIGKKKYAQNYRGLPGRGANALIGPGNLAQMDSTILDCTLVLPGTGRKVIGRPTLYIMVDVFSRLVMGFYSMMEYMTANGELKELVAKGKAESERYQAAAQQKIREIAEGAVRRMAGEPERRAPVKGVRKNRKEAQRAEQEQKRTSVLESGLPEIKPQQVARQVPTKEDTQSEHDALNPLQEKILEKDLLLTGWGSDDDEI